MRLDGGQRPAVDEDPLFLMGLRGGDPRGHNETQNDEKCGLHSAADSVQATAGHDGRPELTQPTNIATYCFCCCVVVLTSMTIWLSTEYSVNA